MGKLTIERNDLSVLERLTGGKLSVKGDGLHLAHGGTTIIVDEMTTRSHVEHNGVRFDLDVRINEKGLELGFK